MDRNGLYGIEFSTPLGTGNGVVVLKDGVAQGGDSMIFYIGNYELKGDVFSAKIKTGAHCHPPGGKSVFGLDNVNITLTGQFAGQEAVLSGAAAEAPGVALKARLRKLV